MTSPTDERVAAKVRGKIAEKRARQLDVATAIGLGQPSLSRRLAGAIPFTYSELEAIATFLNVPVSALIGETAAAS